MIAPIEADLENQLKKQLYGSIHDYTRWLAIVDFDTDRDLPTHLTCLASRH